MRSQQEKDKRPRDGSRCVAVSGVTERMGRARDANADVSARACALSRFGDQAGSGIDFT